VSAERLYPGVPQGTAPLPGLRQRQAGGPALLLLIVALFAVNAFMQFPGTMSNDAINQYAEAISGRYTDWHPAIMAWLWSLLRHVADGPAPLWLLHLALYWTGFGLFADALRRLGHPRIALLTALCGAFPVFVFLNGTLNKDVGMAVTWLVAVGLLFWFRSQQRRIPWPAGLLIAALVFYGTLVRSNALFGLGPLLMYALVPARWLRTSRLLAGALLIAVLAIPTTQFVNRALFHPLSRDAINSLFLFDLTGIAAHVHDPALLEPRATLSASELKACYTPYWWDSLSPWGRCKALVHRPSGDYATYGDGLVSQWARTVAQHPAAYVAHRLKHFNSALIFAVPLKHVRFTPEHRTDDPAWKPGEVYSERDIRFDMVRKNFLFWPVTWLVWGVGLLVFASRQAPTAQTLLARILTVSALGYSGAYLVIGVATDMRYHYWSILAVLMATLVSLPLLIQGWRSRSPALLGALGAVGVAVVIGLAARLLDFQALMF
jgi:hypothetical protein